jgi:hypothetical protein
MPLDYYWFSCFSFVFTNVQMDVTNKVVSATDRPMPLD